MKLKLIAASAALLLSQVVIAAPDKPAACPDIDALKNVGVSAAVIERDGWVGFELKNNLSTNEEWTFATGVYSGNFKSVALAKANANITDLVLIDGPVEDTGSPGNPWVCYYSSVNDPEVIAVTVTPAIKLDQVAAISAKARQMKHVK